MFKNLKSKCFVFLLLVSSTLISQNYIGDQKEIDIIIKNTENFSQFYMNAEYAKLASCYTEDGKIFPNRADIIVGHEAIQKRWTLPENVKVLLHKVSPEEIRVENDYAYDYGYYNGETLRANGETVTFKGKYVIVWKKIENDWKIYLDIWNAID